MVNLNQYDCNLCSKSFSSRSLLTRHLKNHSAAGAAVGGGGDAVGPDERAAAELALARVTRPLGGGEGDEEGVLVWWADLNATDDVGEEVVL